MKNEFTYRQGTVADIPDMQRIGLISYGQFKDVLGAEAWEKMAGRVGSEETYTKLLDIAQSFICESNREIVGMSFLIPAGNPFAFFQSDWSYIRLIGVDPAHEGKGIGRELTRLCVDQAKNSGEKIIALHTSEFQNAARHIYENMGFKKLKDLDPIYGKKYFLYTQQLN